MSLKRKELRGAKRFLSALTGVAPLGQSGATVPLMLLITLELGVGRWELRRMWSRSGQAHETLSLLARISIVTVATPKIEHIAAMGRKLTSGEDEAPQMCWHWRKLWNDVPRLPRPAMLANGPYQTEVLEKPLAWLVLAPEAIGTGLAFV